MDYYEKKSLGDIISKANKGDRDAQVALGLLHELDLLADASIVEAVKLFEEAAKAGDPIAAISVAEIYQHGRNPIKADRAKAEEFYEIAKSLGFSRPEERKPSRNKSQHNVSEALIGKKILIIDEPGQQTTQIAAELTRIGCKPIELSDPQNLPNTLTLNQDIECFFVDIEIFAPNHTQVLSTIRKFKAFKTTPILVITKITDIDLIKKAKAFGVGGWILKPVKEDIIAESAKKLIS